jgi:hypothetical protein
MALGKKKRDAAAARVGKRKTQVEAKAPPRTARARRSRGAGEPRELPELDPFAEMPPQPDWVARDFPAYVQGSHVSGPVSSKRVSYAGGHEIEITTTYSVSIDGVPTPVHLLVDSDGQLWSHLCPYRTFPNANELIAFMIEHVPEALTNIHAGHGATGHAGHAGGEA